jgi:hypothetical protein
MIANAKNGWYIEISTKRELYHLKVLVSKQSLFVCNLNVHSMKYREKLQELLFHFVQHSSFLAKFVDLFNRQSNRSEKGGGGEDESGGTHLEGGGGLLLLELKDLGGSPGELAVGSSRELLITLSIPRSRDEEFIIDSKCGVGSFGRRSERSRPRSHGNSGHIVGLLLGTLGRGGKISLIILVEGTIVKVTLLNKLLSFAIVSAVLLVGLHVTGTGSVSLSGDGSGGHNGVSSEAVVGGLGCLQVHSVLEVVKVGLLGRDGEITAEGLSITNQGGLKNERSSLLGIVGREVSSSGSGGLRSDGIISSGNGRDEHDSVSESHLKNLK